MAIVQYYLCVVNMDSRRIQKSIDVFTEELPIEFTDLEILSMVVKSLEKHEKIRKLNGYERI
jgi:hypothetical protein